MRSGQRKSDELIDAIARVAGISKVVSVNREDCSDIQRIEEEAESRSLMGLGKVINVGIREVLGCDFIYAAFTNMDFNWGCDANLVMKKGDEIVGEEVSDPDIIERLSKDKNVWFLHRNFVVYKNKVKFPQDVMQKICYFEIPPHPAKWLDLGEKGGRSAIYASPSPPCDLFLKARYFESRDVQGEGTMLVGIKFKH